MERLEPNRSQWGEKKLFHTSLRRAWSARWKPGRTVGEPDDWGGDPRSLYTGLTKAESSLAFQLRSEVVGFNDFLAAVRVPDVLPQCPCGWERQTPSHVVTFCPELRGRDAMFARAGSRTFREILSSTKGLKAVTQWLIRQGVLPQFSLAKEMEEEDRQRWRAMPTLQEMGEGDGE